jgi:putative acetyltransferase
MAVDIAVEGPLQDEMRERPAALNRTVMPLTRREFQFQLTVEQIADPAVHLLVALKEHGSALGDVRRMDSQPAVRGGRVGSTLPARIEVSAIERGISRLVLETGEAAAFKEAWRLFESNGHVRCGTVLDDPGSGASRSYQKKFNS